MGSAIQVALFNILIFQVCGHYVRLQLPHRPGRVFFMRFLPGQGLYLRCQLMPGLLHNWLQQANLHVLHQLELWSLQPGSLW